ncbi:MAG: hypothetical protein M3O70_28220 [Actinomycetota bacterium]|nr:hypothetical protein [Actinomycetota bacterium]
MVDKQTDVAVARLLATYIFPLLLLANLFGLIVTWRGAEGRAGDISYTGGFRAKRPRTPQVDTEVTFEDVAGVDQAVADLREVIDYLTDAKRFETYGLESPKGLLLFGPPGCGKTPPCARGGRRDLGSLLPDLRARARGATHRRRRRSDTRHLPPDSACSPCHRLHRRDRRPGPTGCRRRGGRR